MNIILNNLNQKILSDNSIVKKKFYTKYIKLLEPYINTIINKEGENYILNKIKLIDISPNSSNKIYIDSIVFYTNKYLIIPLNNSIKINGINFNRIYKQHDLIFLEDSIEEYNIYNNEHMNYCLIYSFYKNTENINIYCLINKYKYHINYDIIQFIISNYYLSKKIINSVYCLYKKYMLSNLNKWISKNNYNQYINLLQSDFHLIYTHNFNCITNINLIYNNYKNIKSFKIIPIYMPLNKIIYLSNGLNHLQLIVNKIYNINIIEKNYTIYFKEKILINNVLLKETDNMYDFAFILLCIIN